MKAVLFAHNYEYRSKEAVLYFSEQGFRLMHSYKAGISEKLCDLRRGTARGQRENPV